MEYKNKKPMLATHGFSIERIANKKEKVKEILLAKIQDYGNY